MAIFSGNIINSSGGSGGGPAPGSGSPYPVEYDYIVNASAVAGLVYIGEHNVYATLQQALDAAHTDGVTEPRIRIDNDDVSPLGGYTIPTDVVSLRLYSENKSQLDGVFYWVHDTETEKKFSLYGLRLYSGSQDPYLNLDELHEQPITITINNCEMETNGPLIFTVINTVDPLPINFSAIDSVFSYYHVAGSIAFISLNEPSAAEIITFDRCELRILGELQSPFIETKNGTHHNLSMRFSNCNIRPMYVEPLDTKPSYANNYPIFLIDSDTNVTTLRPELLFESCIFEESVYSILSIGTNDIVRFTNSVIDTTAVSWALVNGTTGGHIECVDTTVDGTHPFEYEDGLVVTFNKPYPYPLDASFIVDINADKYYGDGNVFQTVQEGLDWVASNGHTAASMIVPNYHVESDVIVPSTIRSIYIAGGYATNNTTGFGILSLLQTSFVFDMNNSIDARIKINNVVLTRQLGGTQPTLFGNTTTAVSGKRFYLSINNSYVLFNTHLVNFVGSGGNNSINFVLKNSSISVYSTLTNPLITLSDINDSLYFYSNNSEINYNTNHNNQGIIDARTGGNKTLDIQFLNSFIRCQYNLTPDAGTYFLRTDIENGSWTDGGSNGYIRFTSTDWDRHYGKLFELGANSTVELIKCSIGSEDGGVSNTWADGNGTIELHDCIFPYRNQYDYDPNLHVTFNPDTMSYLNPSPYDAIVNDTGMAVPHIWSTITEAMNYCRGVLGLSEAHIRIDIPLIETAQIPNGLDSVSLYSETKRETSSDIVFRWLDTTSTSKRKLFMYKLNIVPSGRLTNQNEITDGSYYVKLDDTIIDISQPLVSMPINATTGDIDGFYDIVNGSSIRFGNSGQSMFGLEHQSNEGHYMSLSLLMKESKIDCYNTIDVPRFSFTEEMKHLNIKVYNSQLDFGVVLGTPSDIPAMSYYINTSLFDNVSFNNTSFGTLENPLVKIVSGSVISFDNCAFAIMAPVYWAISDPVIKSGTIYVSGCSWRYDTSGTYSDKYESTNNLIISIGSNMPTPA